MQQVQPSPSKETTAFGGDMMSQSKVAKVKARQGKRNLMVMHIVSKDDNGNASITSETVGQVPKLPEAAGMSPKPAKTEKAK